MRLPPVTAELAERLEAPIEEFAVARVRALADLPDNPLELRIERFGGAVAQAALAIPDLDFVNRIEGLRAADSERLDAILSFYGAVGARPWLEVTPGLELALPAGAALLGFQTVLYGHATVAAPELPVREADDPGATARLILEAFGAPSEVLGAHGAALADATARTGGRVYVVELDGRPVAGAILTVRDGAGYLALAGTLPDFRGRGCHRALLAARVAAAAESGCELIVATAEFGSVSQRNMEAAGLRIAYTKPVLRLTPPA